VARPSWRFLSQFIWRKQLSRADSIELLKNSIVDEHLSESIPMPVLESSNGIVVSTFAENENAVRNFDYDYVWKLNLDINFKSLKICRCGVPLINNKLLLDLDFGSYAGLLEFPSKVEVVKYPIVVAPWRNPESTYWDFVICTLAKLCRVEEALGREIWQEAKVCYPLMHTHFESQFLEKLGISKDSIIDTQVPHLEVQTECLILANSQSHWVYPSPRDLRLVRNRFIQKER
jgi:hypothetical protein